MTDAPKQAVGSWDWLNETGGALSREEQRSLFRPLVKTFGRFALDRLRLAIRARPRHSYGPADLWPTSPGSIFCRTATEEARELQSTAMVNHGFRTWIFGSALAIIDGAGIDPELFHGGALLHDAGLEDIQPLSCFTRRSADAAREVAERAGVESDRALQMMDGIGMHITPGLTYEESPLGFYLQAGAMADLAGLRCWELPPELRARANDTYPRAEVHKVISSCWHTEGKAVPKGRARFSDVYGGFSKIVRWLPASK